MIIKSLKSLNKVVIFIFIFIFSFCKEHSSYTNKYNDFDFQTLIPVINDKNYFNWILKCTYRNDSLNLLCFIDKKTNKIIKKDTVYNVNNYRYFVDESKVIVKSVPYNIVKINFIKGNKVQRHFLLKKKKNYFLISVEKQNKIFEFENRLINTNRYKFQFKSIGNYLKRIDDKKYFFSDFISYKFIYVDSKLLFKQFTHFSWGVSNPPNYSVIKNEYGNLYLDLNNFSNKNLLLDSPHINKLQ